MIFLVNYFFKTFSITINEIVSLNYRLSLKKERRKLICMKSSNKFSRKNESYVIINCSFYKLIIVFVNNWIVNLNVGNQQFMIDLRLNEKKKQHI